VPQAAPHAQGQQRPAQRAGAVASVAQPQKATWSGTTAVAVVAPGAGTRANGSVYSSLGGVPDFQVEMVGRSGAEYDCYPENWRQGRKGQNLESFASELLQQGIVDSKDLLVFGSRGGQVVLPYLWRCRGNAVPPAVVINGGCANKLPTPTLWPEAAVTFLLLGGKDHFAQGLSEQAYLAQSKSHVPPSNRTTAILLVNEMEHMPQPQLLECILQPMMRAVLAWKKTGVASVQELGRVREGLQKAGNWSGRLLVTTGPGQWHEEAFGPRQAALALTLAMRLGGA